MNKIKKIPLPMAGLVLGMFALGNLLRSYGENLRNIIGIASSILLVLISLKIIVNFSGTKDEMKNPVVATVFPTYSMSLMLFASYLKPLVGQWAIIFWYIGVLLHIFLILKISIKYIPNFNIKNMFPSWFITFVGIVVASVTAPAFSMEHIGRLFFWFGLGSYLILIPLNIKKVYIDKGLAPPAKATIAIFAAPGSLLLAGYISSFPEKNMLLFSFLIIISQFFYWFVVVQMPKLLGSQFYPSFSSFTFPLVISGLSLKLANKVLLEKEIVISALKYMVKFEELFAAIMVSYVLVKYLQFIVKTDK